MWRSTWGVIPPFAVYFLINHLCSFFTTHVPASEQILNRSILQRLINHLFGYTIQLLSSQSHPCFLQFINHSLPPFPSLFFLPLTQNAVQAEQAQLSYKKALNGEGRGAVQQELCRRTYAGIREKAAPLQRDLKPQREREVSTRDERLRKARSSSNVWQQ